MTETQETQSIAGFDIEGVLPDYLLNYEWRVPADHRLDWMDCANLKEEAMNFAESTVYKTGQYAGTMCMEFHGQTIYGTWELD